MGGEKEEGQDVLGRYVAVVLSGNTTKRHQPRAGLRIAGALVLLWAAAGLGQTAATAKFALQNARQLLLVRTEDWQAFNGVLQRYERNDRRAAWRPVGAPIAVVVGRSGLAWGRGVQANLPAGPLKAEGDGKAPAGVFRLGSAFGHSKRGLPGLRLPYLYLDDTVECVDDSHSRYYNQLVARPKVAGADWQSSERMRAEPLYKWGLVVEHNSLIAQPRAGSCIFLHIWNGPGHGTSGCTAMEERKLLETLKWLDSARQPLLVQLPQAEYERLKPEWGLP